MTLEYERPALNFGISDQLEAGCMTIASGELENTEHTLMGRLYDNPQDVEKPGYLLSMYSYVIYLLTDVPYSTQFTIRFSDQDQQRLLPTGAVLIQALADYLVSGEIPRKTYND